MKTAIVFALALIVAGCGREALDELFSREATADCQAQGLTESMDGFKDCYNAAYAKARDVR
ncbi:hypothetical protein [Paenirhodobacter sp.]|uniref:hypothetical protein n=1 Tax=Paenirhodobacter sp. TaxID=1965326 RepID=UPI003B40F751